MAQDKAGTAREFGQLDTRQLKLSHKDPLYDIYQNLNRILRTVYVRLNLLEGASGPISLGANINLNANLVTNSGDAVDAGDLISLSYAAAHYGPIAMADALSLGGTNPLNVSGLRGQLFQAQPAAAPRGDPSVILTGALDGQLFVFDNILYRVDATTNPFTAVPISGTAVVLQGTHAARLSTFPAASYTYGTLFRETDRNILYVDYNNSGHVWRYAGGIYEAVFASRPADLGTDDIGFPFYGTNTGAYYLWDGSAWQLVGGAGAGFVTTTGSPSSGNLTKFSGATSVTSADLTGDVTTSGTVATTIASNAVTTSKITNSNVTYAKIQNVSATDKVLGRSTAGAGVVEEITCTAFARSVLDDTDAATARATLGVAIISMSVFFPGTMAGDGLTYDIFKASSVFTFSFPAGIATWRANVQTNPGGTATFTFKKNGSSFGTLAISTIGGFTWTSASGASFADGDLFSITTSSDGTIQSVMISAFGTRA